MRTLKKTLCLILALVMVLGLCAVSVAAEFTDADEIKYDEAVGVMAAAKVLDGFDDGSFRPDGTLTRAQAAKMIVCMLDMGDLKGTADFTDVPATHWASSYIAICVAEGIVVGRGDGTFDPEGLLTGSAWAKMVLCALGYNDKYEGFGAGDTGWEIAVAKKVKELKLAAAIPGFVGSDPIDRETASQIAFVGMNQPTKNYKPGITANGVEISGEYVKDGASLLANKGITASKAEDVAKLADAFGRPYAAEYKNAKGDVVYSQVAEPIATVDGKDFDSTDTKAYKDWTWCANSAISYNGGTDAKVTVASLKGKAGATIELFGAKNSKGGYDVSKIVVAEPFFATVKAIAAKTGNVTLTVTEAGRVIAKSGTKDITIAAPGKDEKPSASYTAVKDFAKDDVIAVVLTPGWDAADATPVVLSAEACTAVEGKATAKKADAYYNGTVTFAGTTYTFANEYNQAALAAGSEGTLYVAPSGAALGFVATKVEETSTYAYVVAGYKESDTVETGYGDGTLVYKYFAQCVNMDGEEVVYQLKTELKSGDANLGKLVKVTEAYDADVKATVATFTTPSEIVSSSNTAVATTDKKVSGTSHYFSSVKFIYVDGSLNTLKVVVKSGAQAVASGKTIQYVAADVVGSTSNKSVSAVFVTDKYTEPQSTEIVYVYNDDAASTSSAIVKDKDGKDATGWEKTVYVDGEKTTIYVEAAKNTGLTSKDAGAWYTFTKTGDFTVLTSTSGDNLKDATAITNVYGGLISTKDFADKAIEGAKFVNMVPKSTIEEASELIADDTVALVLDAKGNISIIYLVAAASRD